MLQPQADWYWYVDEKAGNLSICLGGDLHFATAYPTKNLINHPGRSLPFSIEHMELYSQVSEKLTGCHIDLNNAQKTQVALNAVAALLFHKPVTPKSWHFVQSSVPFDQTDVARIKTESGEGLILLLESNENMSTGILISSGLLLTQTKALDPFSVHKIANNRLFALEGTNQQAKIA